MSEEEVILVSKEGEEISVPEGYDPTKFKLVGNVKGTPPYKGTVTHCGWETKKESLPKTRVTSSGHQVLSPVEVEIS